MADDSVNVPVVAIDGPSGAGKGTLASRLAAELGFHLLDSGAIYRAAGLAAELAGVDLANEPAVVKVCSQMQLGFVTATGDPPVRTLLNGEDISEAIRTEACGNLASMVAVLPRVRLALLQRQRDFRRPPGLVADGRDMGTVVFSCAAVKLFVTASAQRRAERRHKQLIAKGSNVNLQRLLEEIEGRDKRDRERAAAPLKPADDAVLLDTSDLGPDTVFEIALEVIRTKVDSSA